MSKKWLICILCIILLFIVCLFNSDDIKDEPIKYYEFKETSMDVKYIYKIKKQKIYYVGINYLSIDNEEFINYLEKHSINDLKEKFNQKVSYRDGGSTLYFCDDDTVCDTRIKVLYCNTLDKNKDIYLINSKYENINKLCN